jgi:hypothetical protein
MERNALKVIHVYDHDAARFERRLNLAVGRVIAANGSIDELLYAIDPSTADNRRGGFGALLICEVPEGANVEPEPEPDEDD